MKYIHVGKKGKSVKESQIETSEMNIKRMFGYDVTLVARDLQKTALISTFLISVLVFLSWYLPIGILSS